MFRSLRSLLVAWIVSLLLAIMCNPSPAQMSAPERVSSASQESRQSKIARALSAGPPNVTKNATVAEMDAQGQMKILRPGPMISRACREIPKASDHPQCVRTKSQSNGIAISRNTRQSRLPTFRVSNTCSRERRSEATPTHSTKLTHPSESDHIG